jgi:hypothetical protein
MPNKAASEANPDRRGFLRRLMRHVLPWFAPAAGNVLSENAETETPPSVTPEPLPEAVKRELDSQWEEFARDNPDYARPLDS